MATSLNRDGITGFKYVVMRHRLAVRGDETRVNVESPHIIIAHICAFVAELFKKPDMAAYYLRRCNQSFCSEENISPGTILWDPDFNPFPDPDCPPPMPNATIPDLIVAARAKILEVVERWKENLQTSYPQEGLLPELPPDIDRWDDSANWEIVELKHLPPKRSTSQKSDPTREDLFASSLFE